MGKSDEFASLVYELSHAAGDPEKMQIAARKLLMFVAENAAKIGGLLREDEELEKAIPETLNRMYEAFKQDG
jgi:hypothetical protein